MNGCLPTVNFKLRSQRFRQWLVVALVGVSQGLVPASVLAQAVVPLQNQATYRYQDAAGNQFDGISNPQGSSVPTPSPLVGRGQILDCSGNPMGDYSGFMVGLYEPAGNNPSSVDLGNLVSLTRTEIPDIPNNGVPRGLEPNNQNQNPFRLSNTDNPRGTYTLLLDPNRGQLQANQTYILAIVPPSGSIYAQRRIRIQLLQSTGQINNSVIRYSATALDGQPISSLGLPQLEETFIAVPNAEPQGLDPLALQLTTILCEPNQIKISKTADRATAEPGDTVIYRLAIRNQTVVALNNIVATDTLPVGFGFIPRSLRGEVFGQRVSITVEQSGRSLVFRSPVPIPVGGVLSIVYAAEITPDAVRGTGINSANVQGLRADNRFRVQDGPSLYKLRIQPGILADCGTIIGRVFVDKNFDGEQQPGEPGVPNAVVFLENGNRVVTDANGLFSVANVLPGYHTGVVDLSSLPGYTLAPNPRVLERNSQSRLVHLEPGGLVRMNFAVTPIFQKEAKP